ncbi:hypothetical protein VNI00_014820 [Paramarasmius palmivorus]|uniref:Uncharacterized protein n=1 Tax=Paramarasmius palmivorus TaxID=297713 RepID=A0AAW0BRU4_9AGAR
MSARMVWRYPWNKQVAKALFNIEPKHETCPVGHGLCKNPVVVLPCTGSRNKDHRGYWYEACYGPDPRFNHFIEWQDEPPIHLPDFDLIRFRNNDPNASLEDNLTQITLERFKAYPPTPLHSHSPQKYTDGPANTSLHPHEALFDLTAPIKDTPCSTPHSTPSWNLPSALVSPRTQLPSLPELPDISDDTNEDDFFTDTTNPLPERFQKAASATTASTTTPTTTPTQPSSTATAPAPNLSGTSQDVPWKPNTSMQAAVNGHIRDVCAGKCPKTTAKAAKPAQACKHKFCASCCKRYQTECPHVERCKVANHKPDVAAGTGSTGTPSSAPVQTVIPEPRLRPLAPIHYQKWEESHQRHTEASTYALNRQKYEADAQKVVEILYWNEEGELQEFECQVKTYLMFVLTDAPEYVRAPIGDHHEFYDLESGRWKVVGASIPRRLRSGQALLFRASGAFGKSGLAEPDEMKAAMVKQSSAFKVAPATVYSSPRKRKVAELDEDDVSIVTPKRTKPLISSSAQPLPHPQPPSPCPSSPEPLDLSLPIQPIARTVHAPAPSTAMAPIPPVASGLSLNMTLSSPQKKERSHGNAPWPLLYFAPMKEGLDKLYESEMLGRQSKPTHHEIFPTSTASLSTRNRAYAQYFNPEFQSIRDEFARNPKSLWKDYVKQVKESSGDAVPTFQSLKSQLLGRESKNRRAGKSQKGKEAVRVKEEEVTAVKKEDHENNVLDITSDDDDLEMTKGKGKGKEMGPQEVIEISDDE